MFYDDGYFIQNFYQYYHLPDNPLLYYFSEDCPNLFYNGTRLTHPAKQSGQTVYLPLEPVVTALGGSLAWNGDVLTIRLNDAEVVCAENMLTFSGGHIDLSGRTQRHFGKLYWEDRLLFEVFGITCTKDAENQITVEFR